MSITYIQLTPAELDVVVERAALLAVQKASKQQADALLRLAEEARQKEVAAAIEAIKVQMTQFGITLQELKAAGAEPGKPLVNPNVLPTPPKYRGPDGELWAGGV